MPVLFYFHGAGSNAKKCGGSRAPEGEKKWSEYAVEHEFAYVCGEAPQYPETGGLWQIP